MKGVFISLEGLDGSGKTTQVQQVAAELRRQGYDVLTTREPGGTELAEKVRDLVLDPKLPLNNITQVLLYLAARSEHVEKVIRPALAAGKIVLCDRFSDSTLVYQGLTKGLTLEELEPLRRLNAYACQELAPDLTLILDGEPRKLLTRREKRGVSDRYEIQGLDFQERLRQGFLTLAAAEPQRMQVINAEGAALEVEAEILAAVQHFLKKA